MDWTVGTFGTVGNDALDAGDCLRTSWTPMKPAAAKVGGNQGQMVGQRLAVGFLQIVLGVFPTGGGLTDYVSRPWSERLAHSDKTAH